jgi:hypothetical protein
MAETVADALPVDEFAQTRGVDDLFDDEIIPISAEQQAQPVEHATGEQRTEEDTTQDETSATRRPRGHYRGAPGERGRGRGRGRGGRGGRPVQDGPPKSEALEEKVDQVEKEAIQDGDDQTTEEDKEQATKEDLSPSKPSGHSEAPRVQAVRGDRSGTGGIKKVWTGGQSQVTQRVYKTDCFQPKLTEEELAERMAAAKLNAAKKAAAHARAEADEASFQQREKVAAEKRRQELVNRKAMDGERERNRLRKLGAQTGREWDAEKREEDFTGRRGGSQYRRGMHGGVTGFSRRDDVPEEDGSNHRGRGRGGGGRGGRGRGRGSHRGGRGDFSGSREGTPETAAPSAPGVSNESEFPALPGSANKASEDAAAPGATNTTLSPPAAPASGSKVSSPNSPLSPSDGTWAEEMDSRAARADSK